LVPRGELSPRCLAPAARWNLAGTSVLVASEAPYDEGCGLRRTPAASYLDGRPHFLWATTAPRCLGMAGRTWCAPRARRRGSSTTGGRRGRSVKAAGSRGHASALMMQQRRQRAAWRRQPQVGPGGSRRWSGQGRGRRGCAQRRASGWRPCCSS